jgi:hypothetical protein
MNIRQLGTTLSIAALCLFISNASTPQTRGSSASSPRAHAPKVIPGLSPETRASIAGIQAVNVPWVDSLESGAPGWTKTGFWHVSYQPQHIEVLNPAINPTLVLLPDSGFLPAAYSGNNAFWYGEDVTGTYIGSDFTQVTQFPLGGGTSNGPNTGSAITPPINLVGQKTPMLSFWTWWEIEGVNTNDFDLMNVEASTDTGVTWSPIGRGVINPVNNPNGNAWKAYASGGLGQRGKWIQAFFDLTSYAGKVILVRFRFDTGDALYNGFRGWLIDNISVTASGAAAPTITSVSPQAVNASQLVDVIGTNFVSGATLRVDTTVVFGAAVSSTTLMQFYAPAEISNGFHSIRITNPDGKSVVRANAFSITTDLPPSLYAIVPDSAPAGASIPITLSGSNFAAGATVDIGGLPATNVQFVGATQITASSPGKLPAGVFNVTVTNPDGLSDVSVLGFRVFAPPINVNATGDSLIGNAQPLTITPPAGNTFTSGKIFYRKGGVPGAASYDSVALTVGTGNFSVNLPAGVITIRGVEYYVRLDGVQGSVTYPASNPALNPAVLPVRLSKLATPLALSPLKYKMFSAPMILDSPNVMNQLGDDYGSYNTARWRVFHWEGGAYREAGVSSAAAGPMAMVPGKAYWLVTSDGVPFTFKHGMSVPTGQYYTVPVDTGWNQIGNPFAFSVAWAAVGGSTQVTGPYYYDGSQYQIITTDVKPYEGYFVYNPPFSETSFLTFYPVESIFVVHKDGFGPASLGPGEFVMQIAAAIPGTEFRDTYNYVGLRTGASAGRDMLDAPKPPPIGDGVQVDILDGGTAYLQNFKPVGGEGQSWVFDVRTLGTKGKAVMTLTPSGTLPTGFSIHVLDLENENALPAVSGAFEVALDAPGAPRYYKVIMGTDAFVAKESNGIPLTPVSYALEQNYPNPFNPSTTIRYSLAKKSDVVLEICNTLGQRVRMLVSGVRSTGQYESLWDGTNDNGRHVASGVYFYRLRTGEYNAVRKLVMIR